MQILCNMWTEYEIEFQHPSDCGLLFFLRIISRTGTRTTSSELIGFCLYF